MSGLTAYNQRGCVYTAESILWVFYVCPDLYVSLNTSLSPEKDIPALLVVAIKMSCKCGLAPCSQFLR